MEKKGKYVAIFLIFTMIVLFGFFKVNMCLPQSIRNKLNFKISYSLKPFDFTVETKNYIFYVNKDALNDTKNKIGKAMESIINKASKPDITINKVYDDLYSEFYKCVNLTHYGIRDLGQKAENVFKNLKPN